MQSLETASIPDLIATIRSTQPSTIIFAAGAGAGSPASRTQAVDFGSAVKAAEATAQSGVTKRYIIISALDVRDRENCRVPDWYDEKDRVMSERVWGAIGHYMQAKFEADRDLVRENGRRGLEFTIVRPGGLRDEEGTGRIEAGKVHFGERMIAREVSCFFFLSFCLFFPFFSSRGGGPMCTDSELTHPMCKKIRTSQEL